MLRYLRILAWFLLTFGVVGLVSAWLGIDIGIGVGPSVAVLMAVQVAIAGLIFGGFYLLKHRRLHPRVLSAGAIVLILFYVVAGQIWLNVARHEQGSNVRESSGVSAEAPPT